MSELAQNARVSIVGLGTQAAGIAQGRDGSDPASPCHGWVPLPVTRCSFSQAGDRVSCPTSSSVVAPGSDCIWVIHCFFLAAGTALHPAKRPTLLRGLWGRVVLMAYCWQGLGSCLALSCHALASYLHLVCSVSACSVPVACFVYWKLGDVTSKANL